MCFNSNRSTCTVIRGGKCINFFLKFVPLSVNDQHIFSVLEMGRKEAELECEAVASCRLDTLRLGELSGAEGIGLVQRKTWAHPRALFSFVGPSKYMRDFYRRPVTSQLSPDMVRI